MSQLKTAIIGCGRMGKMHIENIQNNMPHVTIAAVVDNHPDAQWLVEHQIDTITNDVDSILSDVSIKSIIIATSSVAHVSLIEKAAMHGKDIFCEKPVSFEIEGILRAQQAIQKNQVKLQVGFNRRFDPSFSRIRAMVKDGCIGSLYSVRITNRDPRRPDLSFIPRSGGLFLDFHIHDFDMIRFVTGQDIESVQAFGINIIDPQIGALGDIDTSVISCQLTGGAIASIDASREAVYGYDQHVEVLGSLGSVAADNQPQNNLSVSTQNQIATPPLKTTFIERYQEAYQDQLRAFFEYIEQDHLTSPVGLDDTLQAVACSIAAKKSMQENRTVSIQELI